MHPIAFGAIAEIVNIEQSFKHEPDISPNSTEAKF